MVYITYCKDKVLQNITDKIDPLKVNFILKPGNLCQNIQQTDLFFYVFSKVESGSVRRTIRKTWADRNFVKNIRLVFILGLSQIDHINEVVKSESATYKDILQGSFIVNNILDLNSSV